MGIIKQLPPLEAQKIAAGEVIERPANIVKELIENSLDAGSTVITIYIEDAGKKLIRIIDNGCGMSPDDAKMCINHHATSKISAFSDLTTLKTFGFRGEALASISSVSNIILQTKEKNTIEGTKLTINQGNIVSQESCSTPIGTDISIADLFFNIPVRKKFLRSNTTELNQIVYLFQALCLAHQNVHFKLYSQNKLIHNCPATEDLSSRLFQVWDQLISSRMITIETEQSDSIKIKGMISDHQLSRYDRNHLLYFVNNRWVKNYTLSRAIMQGYANVLPAKKFPVACIFIELPTEEVDVNIHPRKEEVQFINPRKVQNSIEESIRKTVEKKVSKHLNIENDHYIPSITPPEFKTPYSYKINDNKHDEIFPAFDHMTNQAYNLYHNVENEPRKTLNTTTISKYNFHENSEQNNLEHNSKKQIASPLQSIEPEVYLQHNYIESKPLIIGQCLSTYIMLDTNKGILLIDQHAAHERILYEKFSSLISAKESIPLLFPQIIPLNQEDIAIIEPYLELFHDHGIVIEQLDPKNLRVNSICVSLKNVNMQEVIAYTISYLNQNHHLENLETELLHGIRAQMACKGAIKAGDELNMQQMEELINKLNNTPNRLTCPHGRPTSWHLEKNDIERKFKRKL